TIFDGELDLDDLRVAIVDGWSPTDTRMPLGAGGLLCLPIDIKVARRKAFFRLSLPFDIGTCGTNQIDAIILLTAVQQLGINIARIDDMLLGQQFSLLEPFVDGGGSGIVGDRGGGRLNMGNQVW